MKIFNKANTRSKGQEVERAAEKYLNQHGLLTIARNYTCRFGEIDLVMQDQENCLVFVEVRGRKPSQYGSAAGTVTPSKQKKIIVSAQNYISENKISAHQDMRFDVIGVQLNPSAMSFDWIKGAFYGV